MRKKTILAILFVFMVISLLGGCETTRCIVQGVSYTAEGVTKDAKSFWQAILQADAWVKKHLW